MNTRQSKVKPIVVEVAIRNAIARRMRDHGIAQFDTIADEVVLDLFGTRIVPTPDGVPTGFIYQGTHLDWPQGVDTRAVTADEAATYTRLFALKWDDGLLEGESVKAPVVTTDDNAAHLRMAYQALWSRIKSGKAQVESPVVVVKVRDWLPVADLPPNDGRAMAAAWEHLRVFGPVQNIHEPAECLNTGTCTDPTPPSDKPAARKKVAPKAAPKAAAKKAAPKAPRKKVQPVVPEVILSAFDQELADLDALMADL